MKRILILISILLIVTSCGVKKNKFKKDIISTLPATVDFVVSVDSIKVILDDFITNNNYFSLFPKIDFFEPKSELNLSYKIDFNYAIRSKLDSLAYILENYFTQNRIKLKNIVVKDSSLVLELSHISDIDEVKKIVSMLNSNLILKDKKDNLLTFSFKKEFLDKFKKEIIQNITKTVKKRINSISLDKYQVKYINDSININLISLSKDLEKVKEMIARTAHLEFKSVDDNSTIMDELSKTYKTPDNIDFISSTYIVREGSVPDQYYRTKDINLKYKIDKKETLRKELETLKSFIKTMKIPYSHEISYSLISRGDINYYRTYLLKRRSILTGKNIIKAKSLIDKHNNYPYVSIAFDKDGTRTFADFTKKNTQRRLAIVLDGVVNSAPIIQDEIKGGRASITFAGVDLKKKKRDAEMLALLFKAGSLDAPLTLISSDIKKQKQEVKKVKDILGFDISNLKEWEKIGIDINRLIAFSVDIEKLIDTHNGLDDFIANIYFMIPVKDSSLLFQKVEELSKFNFISVTDKDSMKVITFGDRIKSYLFKKDDYLVWTMTYSKDYKVDHALKSFNSHKKLYDIPSYNLARRKISTADGLYFLANIEGFFQKNNDFIKKVLEELSTDNRDDQYAKDFFTSLKDFKFLTSSIKLGSKDFNFKFFAEIFPNSILKKSENIRYEKRYTYGIKENVLSIFSLGQNMDNLSILVKSFLLGFNEGYSGRAGVSFSEDISKGLGIDFKKDLISQLDGNFNLAVFNASEINPMNHNFIITFTIKDRKSIYNTLTKIKNKYYEFITSKEKDGLLIYRVKTPMMISIYITIKENSVIISTSKTFFDKALAAKNIRGNIFSIAKENNFTNQLDSGDFLYLDFNQLSEVFKTFNMSKQLEFIKPFKTIILSSKHKNSGIYGEFTLKMNSDELFFNILFKLIKSYL